MRGLKLADTAFLARTGAAAGITPPDFAGLQGWWKADALVLSDTNPVSTWVDSSGNGRTMLQATGGLQPLYRTAIYNGLPTVRYDGTNDFLALAAPHSLADSLTMMAVATSTVNEGLVFGAASGANQARTRRAGADEMNFFPGGTEATSGAGWLTGIGAFKLLTWKRTAGGAISFAQNAEIRLNISVGGAFSFEILGAGAASGLVFGGDISEAAYWNVALSDVDITALYNDYFKPKWGLP